MKQMLIAVLPGKLKKELAELEKTATTW